MENHWKQIKTCFRIVSCEQKLNQTKKVLIELFPSGDGNCCSNKFHKLLMGSNKHGNSFRKFLKMTTSTAKLGLKANKLLSLVRCSVIFQFMTSTSLREEIWKVI